MYSAKAASDMGLASQMITVTCIVCGHQAHVVDKPKMVTCRCGAEIEVEYEELAHAITEHAFTIAESSDAEHEDEDHLEASEK
jgi:ribosomal protein S27E